MGPWSGRRCSVSLLDGAEMLLPAARLLLVEELLRGEGYEEDDEDEILLLVLRLLFFPERMERSGFWGLETR